MLTYLREIGVMLPQAVREFAPVELLIDDYREWLIADRGLAAMTVLRYETLARRFLTSRVTPTDELGVSDLDGAVVSRFLLGECDRVCLGSAKGKVAELRSLLRFLHVRGFTPRSLAESVPGVAGWRETTIPPTMPQADIEALLVSCDRSTLDGARDHAMLMLLARLGLRSIEIARLQLDDLDWRAGDLLVRGKARRDDRLPIPDDVGAALAEYLALRGRHDSRSVFLDVAGADPSDPRRLGRRRRAAPLPAGGCAACRAAPAQAHARDPDARARRGAGGYQPGAAPQRSRDDRDLRKGRPRSPATGRPAVGRERHDDRCSRSTSTSTSSSAGRSVTSSLTRTGCCHGS